MKKVGSIAAIGLMLTLGIGFASPASASTTAPYIYPTATWSGSPHYATKCVQVALNAHYGIALAVDGLYGPSTQSWVKILQRDAGLTQDAIVGRQTGTLLMGTLDNIGHHADCYPVIPTLS